MTDIEKLEIKKHVEKMMMLQTQMRFVDEISPVEFCLGLIGQTIQMHSNKDFEKVRESFEISADSVTKTWSGELFHKDFKIGHGFEVSVVLDNRDEGYEVNEDDDE